MTHKIMELTTYNHGNRNSAKIALTFDDGPNPFWTEKILDTLDAHCIKAAFFVVGQYAEKNRDIVRKIFDRGHLVGNHTYAHSKVAVNGFERAENVIAAITGERAKFIRPPYFRAETCNDYGPAQTGEARIVNCDVGSGDWDLNRTAQEIVRTVSENVQNGSIVLFHDGSQREEELEHRPAEMLKALPDVIEELKKRFTIVRLDELDLVPSLEITSDDHRKKQANFFIVGAQKAGTTFVQGCLADHPDIFMVPGEVPFFQDPDYRRKSIGGFEELFSQAGDKKIIGIKRPDYLGKPEVPGRIRNYCPDAKLLMIFRDPVERAVSDYFHNINYGFIPPVGIERGMRKLLKGAYEDTYPRSPEIIEFGFYCKHLKHYLEHFKKEQIHTIIFDDIRNNPMKVFRGIYDFLGISGNHVPQRLHERPQAVIYSLPRLKLLRLRNSFLYDYNNDRTRLEIKKRGSLDRFFVRWIDRFDKKILSKICSGIKPTLSPALNEELTAVYRKDIMGLSELLNTDLSRWLT